MRKTVRALTILFAAASPLGAPVLGATPSTAGSAAGRSTAAAAPAKPASAAARATAVRKRPARRPSAHVDRPGPSVGRVGAGHAVEAPPPTAPGPARVEAATPTVEPPAAAPRPKTVAERKAETLKAASEHKLVPAGEGSP